MIEFITIITLLNTMKLITRVHKTIEALTWTGWMLELGWTVTMLSVGVS